MKMTPAFRAYCRRVARNAEAAVTAKRKTRKGLDAIRTLGALALALTVLTPAAIAQDAPRTGFEIQATISVKLPMLWSQHTYKTAADCLAQRDSADHTEWADALKTRLEQRFGEGNVSIAQVCAPAADHADDK